MCIISTPMIALLHLVDLIIAEINYLRIYGNNVSAPNQRDDYCSAFGRI